ncbi:MAG TPA: Crp/Fnr family transcriptional regulator [Sphingomicrobium sp.]
MADLIRLKLEHYTRLSADDVQLLSSLSTLNIRQIQPRRDIFREGERPKVVNLILDGWAVRHKMLEDGRRQILAFLIPGDFCDTKNFVLSEMDHSVGALTAVTVAQIPNEMIQDIERTRPRLSQALNWDLLVQLAIQREWTLNVGQRSAIERISHLICELFVRMKTVGLCHNGVCNIPATQTDLSEATGVTPVHVNRTLQEMRARGLIEWKGREVRVPDMDALQRVGMFNAGYLHLDREGAHLDANE